MAHVLLLTQTRPSSYASADSAVVEAQGEQRQIGDGVGTVMQGSYSYTAPNGELIEVRSVLVLRGALTWGHRGQISPPTAPVLHAVS